MDAKLLFNQIKLQLPSREAVVIKAEENRLNFYVDGRLEFYVRESGGVSYVPDCRYTDKVRELSDAVIDISKFVRNYLRTIEEAPEIDVGGVDNKYIQKKIVGMYNDQEVEHPPLWENAEFKKIKNAVIYEAEKLDVDRVFVPQEEHNTEIIAEEERLYTTDDEITENVVIPERSDDEHEPQTQRRSYIEPMAIGAALNLFCRLATIIDNDAEHKIDRHNKTIVDSKEWKELMKKRQRLGIKMQ